MTHQKKTEGKLAWSKPTVSAISSVKKTRGGPGNIRPSEGPPINFYSVS